jgi:hypothetical protein
MLGLTLISSLLVVAPIESQRAVRTPGGDIQVDLSASQSKSGIAVSQKGTTVQITWPIEAREQGVLVLQLRAEKALIQELAIRKTSDGPVIPLLRNVDAVTLLTVGVRDLSKQGWNAFFDNPPQRPHETFPAVLNCKNIRSRNQGRRCTISLDGLLAGPFHGDLRFTVYSGCRLVHVEAVLSTPKDACAILYDAGLASPSPSWTTIAWLDTNDKLQRVLATSQKMAVPVAARHRTIIAESEGGSVAMFPPPHQFLYPLDFADNFKLVWHGPLRRIPNKVRDAPDENRWGFGVRQPPEGDRRYVPWVNAPPGTEQHLSVFYLLSSGKAPEALEQVRKFTHADRFEKLNGYSTFTSHYHIEHTLNFLEQQKRQKTNQAPAGLVEPPFVKTFKAHGVDILHLAEFHIAHTPEITAQRLPLLKTLHSECRRLSNESFLLLPGEEPNVHLGGHWISLFPRPVYWLLHPKEGTPFEQQVEGLGTVYAVHNSQDVLRLMQKENGLMWTAHPRIKSSYGYPDRYRTMDFYLSDQFLGAAWKAMPADLSQPRLGIRSLNLLDDIANWGQRKYLLGEVDVFKVMPDYELYGHMNINYLKLDKLPRFDDGWQPILDALRTGRFFVSTGEVLMPEFSVGGKQSGQTLQLSGNTSASVEARLEWTFPPAFAEVIWGAGNEVHRQRVDLSDNEAFSRQVIRIPVDLKGAKWVRLEAWDIAANGAFSQPVWIE